MTRLRTSLFLTPLLCLACHATAVDDAAARTRSFVVHDVYFSLTDDSEAAATSLVDGCHEYLADLPGIARFSAGRREPSRTGGVNDTEFDVSLHVWFEDAEAYAVYDTHPRHLALIEEFRENWAGVRVFDSTTTGR